MEINTLDKAERIHRLINQHTKMIETFISEEHSLLECGQFFGIVINMFGGLDFEVRELINNLPPTDCLDIISTEKTNTPPSEGACKSYQIETTQPYKPKSEEPVLNSDKNDERSIATEA